MSNYTSENTKVLATCEQAGGNTRMLLLHECDSGRLEYVIGSYFTETQCARVSFAESTATDFTEYSWDWGHYFGSFEQAAMYWLQEAHGLEVVER